MHNRFLCSEYDRNAELKAGLILAFAVLGIWSVVYLPWLGLLDLLLEEPRRALIARTMLETGDYLVPRLGGEIYTAKPPLFNWIIAISAKLGGGLNEWTARLPSALAVALLAAVFLWTTRSILSLPGTLFLGFALILAPEIVAKGTLAEIEAVFTLLVALSIWSWYLLDYRGRRGWRLWGLPLALVALAYLAKREPAVVFFYLSVVPYLLLQRRWRDLIAPGHIGAALLALGVVGGWLMLVAMQTGWEALWETLQREVLQRGTRQSWQEIGRHVLLYPLELLVAIFPFSLMLPLLFGSRLRAALRIRYGNLMLFCGVALVANLPLYWFRGDASVRYFMPLFPFALVLAAMVFDALWKEPQLLGTRGTRYLNAAGWFCLGLAALLLTLFVVTIALPFFAADRQALLPPLLALCCAAAAGATLWSVYRARAHRFAAALLGSFVLVVLLARAVYFNLLLPDKRQRVAAERNAPAIVAQVRRLAPHTPVAARGVPWAVWYYAPRGMFYPHTRKSAHDAEEWVLLERDFHDIHREQNPTADEIARFRYKGEELLLLRSSRPNG